MPIACEARFEAATAMRVTGTILIVCRLWVQALLWARRQQVPAILMSDSQATDFARNPAVEWLKSAIVRNFSGALVAGQAHRDYACDLGVAPDRVRTGYDVVDNTHFARGADDARENATAQRHALHLPERYFLASARFVEKKNLPFLIDAFRAFRESHSPADIDLVITGDGPLRPQLEAQIRNLGLQGAVHLPGFIQYPDTPKYYGLATAFILSSTTDQWGLVVNEAMASGLPVLVSERCGAAANLVKPGQNGFAFDPNDTDALAALMRRLADAPQPALEQMGAVSRDHITGYPSLAALKWSAGRQPRIVSPHGMLDSWAVQNSSLKKKIVSALYEQRNLTGAACLHALCEAERDAIRDYGLKMPVAIIPNGVDLSIASGTFPRPEWYDRVPKGARILLFLGRIHPKKGLALLLDALSRLERGEADQWHLVIAGWDQGGTEEQLVTQAAELGIAHRIHLVGPQFGAQKNATLAASDAFVLPSLSEGLPMAVLEAWAFSLPVLMTTACNLPEGFAADAAIQLEEAPAVMAEGLRRLTSLSEAQLCKMGANGYELVRRSFTWSEVAHRMRQTYDWVLGGRDQPDFVDLV